MTTYRDWVNISGTPPSNLFFRETNNTFMKTPGQGAIVRVGVVSFGDLERHAAEVAHRLAIPVQRIEEWIKQGSVPAHCRERVMRETATVWCERAE